MESQPAPGAVGWAYHIAGRWSARGGAVAVDCEGSPVRRRLRPVLRLFAVRVPGVSRIGVEFVSDDEFITVAADGTRQTWTRAPAD